MPLRTRGVRGNPSRQLSRKAFCNVLAIDIEAKKEFTSARPQGSCLPLWLMSISFVIAGHGQLIAGLEVLLTHSNGLQTNTKYVYIGCVVRV